MSRRDASSNKNLLRIYRLYQPRLPIELQICPACGQQDVSIAIKYKNPPANGQPQRLYLNKEDPYMKFMFSITLNDNDENDDTDENEDNDDNDDNMDEEVEDNIFEDLYIDEEKFERTKFFKNCSISGLELWWIPNMEEMLQQALELGGGGPMKIQFVKLKGENFTRVLEAKEILQKYAYVRRFNIEARTDLPEIFNFDLSTAGNIELTYRSRELLEKQVKNANAIIGESMRCDSIHLKELESPRDLDIACHVLIENGVRSSIWYIENAEKCCDLVDLMRRDGASSVTDLSLVSFNVMLNYQVVPIGLNAEEEHHFWENMKDAYEQFLAADLSINHVLFHYYPSIFIAFWHRPSRNEEQTLLLQFWAFIQVQQEDLHWFKRVDMKDNNPNLKETLLNFGFVESLPDLYKLNHPRYKNYSLVSKCGKFYVEQDV